MGLQELDLSVLDARGRACATFRAALTDLCFDRGFAALTVEDVCLRAGLGRAVFRSLYADLGECFLDTCASELHRYGRAVREARADATDWRGRLRATAYSLYRCLEEDERLRRLTVVEARAAGEAPALLIDAAIEPLYDLIDEGRAEPSAPSTLTRATAEFLGGAAFNEVYMASLRRGPLPPEREVVPKILYLTVLPYVGEAGAAEELAIPAPSN
jgi:AcrR family transcriptional regulator